MALRERLEDADRQAFNVVAAVASCRTSLFFADLCWPPFSMEAELKRTAEGRDPGVLFATPTRVVVIEEHGGELRYYAGGWPSSQGSMYLEQDRIWAEGYELGVLPSPREAVAFAERFLARGLALQGIDTPRLVYHRRDTEENGR